MQGHVQTTRDTPRHQQHPLNKNTSPAACRQWSGSHRQELENGREYFSRESTNSFVQIICQLLFCSSSSVNERGCQERHVFPFLLLLCWSPKHIYNGLSYYSMLVNLVNWLINLINVVMFFSTTLLQLIKIPTNQINRIRSLCLSVCLFVLYYHYYYY